MSKKSSLSKTSSAVSNAFSWLPNRSQKRSQRAKSEGLEQISSSPSPVDTLQSLCDAENTVDGNSGLELEGIYRVPGNQSQVAELEKQFKLNPNIDLKILNMPLHVIATAIKKFFDTLPEPIIPFTLHLPIIQCIENFPTEDRSPSSMTKSSPGSASSFSTAVETLIPDEQLRQQHIDRLSRLLKHELPIVNQHVLGFLTAHLKRVAKNSHKTSMDVRNLSKVFGPTLFRPEFNSFEMMASQMSKFELAMFLMLQNNDQIFDSN
uniref:Rho-GAP domain-containing protein n=1 Tax=Panagrolaimus sp. PS1159 TaxID=55785 RepID=A0AC35F7W0_9BILA